MVAPFLFGGGEVAGDESEYGGEGGDGGDCRCQMPARCLHDAELFRRLGDPPSRISRESCQGAYPEPATGAPQYPKTAPYPFARVLER